MEHECPVCEHLNPPLGVLGSRIHYRCRLCGIMYSRPKRDYETCDECISQSTNAQDSNI